MYAPCITNIIQHNTTYIQHITITTQCTHNTLQRQHKKHKKEKAMKKASITILLIITFFILLILQENVFRNFTIAGIMPNLFVIFILFIGLYGNSGLSISFGVICGVMIDLLYSKTVGVTAIMLCIIGYLGAYFDKNFSKENKMMIIIMVAAATILFEIGYYGINSILLGYEPEIWRFVKILTIEVLYNILLTILLYPLIQKAGYSMDRAFKKDNILTRYF